MPRATALPRLIALLAAIVALSAGCSSAPVDAPLSAAVPAGAPATVAAGAPAAHPAAIVAGAVAGSAAVPYAKAEPTATGTAAVVGTADPASLPAGTLYLDPATGRREVIEPDMAQTAVLIGDSQSEGAAGVATRNTWTNTALQKLGFHVQFRGKGGTGFVASNGAVGNYPDALEHGNWYLPYGPAPLVVIEGGGNDATRHATDEQILANAARLVRDLKQTYPKAQLVMIGTLAKGADNGGGRRTQVDALLGGFAAKNSIPFISAGNWITRYGLANKMADGVHLTAAGHQVLSGVLATELDKLGIKAPAQGATAVVARLPRTE